ncbi:MAG: hypothetical protein HZT43_07385 [Exiguobacterium profundum]|nr:MAG: hypothetical protein HZT43_07385 [Exiguobacterium profundum]
MNTETGLVHDYTLFVDEVSDDKVDRLRPGFADGNSEWLCLGGYLVRADVEAELDGRRDAILASFGGQAGGVLHFKKLKPKNRVLAVRMLATPAFSARGFVICSYKQTMLNHKNARAAAAA